jgi:hypothetical protein
VLLAEMFSMRAKVRFISHTLVPIQYSTTPFARRAPFREDLRSVKKTHHVSPRGNATLCYPPIARPNTVPDARSSSLGESNRIESNRIESNRARRRPPRRACRRCSPRARRQTRRFCRSRRRRARGGAFYTLVPIRQRSRVERRSLRTLSLGDSLRPPLAFNPRPRRLSTPPLTPLNLTPARRFALVALVCVAAGAYVRSALPETKGKSLASVQLEFAERTKTRRAASPSRSRDGRSFWRRTRCVLYTGPHTTPLAW